MHTHIRRRYPPFPSLQQPAKMPQLTQSANRPLDDSISDDELQAATSTFKRRKLAPPADQPTPPPLTQKRRGRPRKGDNQTEKANKPPRRVGTRAWAARKGYTHLRLNVVNRKWVCILPRDEDEKMVQGLVKDVGKNVGQYVCIQPWVRASERRLLMRCRMAIYIIPMSPAQESKQESNLWTREMLRAAMKMSR